MFPSGRFFAIFVYCIINELCHFIFELYSSIKSLIYGPSSDENTCEILRILYRQPLLMKAISRAKANFIFVNECFVNSDILLSPLWSLYVLDETHVYFIKMPHNIEEYTVSTSPFLYMTQFSQAKQMARMTHKQFCQFAKKIGDPPGPVVYFSNTARSGSTLFCHILQTAPNWVVLAEPDFFTLLPVLYQEKKITQSMYEQLVIAGFSIQCKNQNPQQTYVIKCQSNGTYLVPDIVKSMPSIKHLFSWRRNATKCIESNARQALATVDEQIYLRIWQTFPRLAAWLVGFGRLEYAAWQKAKPIDVIEMMYVLYVTPYITYQAMKNMTTIIYTDYEKLVENPKKEICRIFELLKIDQRYVKAAIGCMNRDSQANTPHSQTILKKVKVENVFTRQRQIRYEEIDKILGLDNSHWIDNENYN